MITIFRISFFRFTISLFFLFLLSCNSKNAITLNEDKGVKEVLKIVGGQCEYSYGKSVSNNESFNFFQLELSHSNYIDSNFQNIDLILSKIGYVFYNEIKNDSTSYNSIKVIGISKVNQRKEYIFDFNYLRTASIKLELINNIVSMINDKRYTDIFKLMDSTSGVEFNKLEFENSFLEIESKSTKINSYELIGFKVIKLRTKSILHFSGILNRESGSHYLSIDVDIDDMKDKIIYLNYAI